MKTLTPYLNFDGQCREAMTFYQKNLGGQLEITPFMDDKGQPSPDPGARVLHSQILVGGKAILQASDTRPGDAPKAGNNVQIAIDCEALEEIDRLFAAFSQERRFGLRSRRCSGVLGSGC